MAVLVSPASYVSLADFKSMAIDYNLSAYSDPQLTDLLVTASAEADSIMRRTLLATERTELFQGDGSNTMSLGTQPILYVKEMQFVQPGISGFVIPLSRVVVDSLKGQIVQYSPLELQGVGYVSVFPRGLPIAITYAVGYGYNSISPPALTAADTPGSGLPPGAYVVAVTCATQWGESLGTFLSYNTATGAFNVVVTPKLGAWKYRVYVAAGAMGALAAGVAQGATSLNVTGGTWRVGQQIVLDPGTAPDTVTITAIAGSVLTVTATAAAHNINAPVSPQCLLVAEIPVTTFGGEATQSTVAGLTPPDGLFPSPAPTADTSMLPVPGYLREAVRLLLLTRLYEQNNPANRGIAGTKSGRKAATFRSTEGSGGKGTPTLWQQAAELLAPKKLATIF